MRTGDQRSGDPTVTLSDEQTERLRSQVPANPITLPVGHLACEECGVAVPVDVIAEMIEPKKARRTPYTRCPDCRALHQRAVELAEEHPFLISRMGMPVVDRIQWTLWALAVIGHKARAGDVAVMLTRLYLLGQKVGFRTSTERVRRECSPYPWAHVGLSERAALRAAFGAALRDRLALRAEPVVIDCPSTACLVCGIATITRSAIEVSRRGSIGATQLATWRAVLVDQTSLGGPPSPERVEGHVCPDCTVATDEVGAVGYRARGVALVAHVERTQGRDVAAWLHSDLPPAVPAWAGMGSRAPSDAHWGHLPLQYEPERQTWPNTFAATLADLGG